MVRTEATAQMPAACQTRGRLQHQGALADAGLTAEQHDRTGDHPSTEHPIELADPNGQAAHVRPWEIRIADGPGAGPCGRATAVR